MSSDYGIIAAVASMVAVAAASGFIGVFALMRRMTLAADAISHVALPGIGVALLTAVNPFLGGGAALLLGAFLIWAIERKTRIATETVIGVMFSASLAVGSIITPEHELLEALFGDLGALSFREAALGIAAGVAIIGFLWRFKERFTLSFISPELAKTSGLNVERLNLVFLIAFAAAIIIGLKFLGVLLMGSLIIVPAAAAKNIARSLTVDFWISIGIAIFSVLSGYFISEFFRGEVGPAAIAVAAAVFFITLFFRR